MTVHAQVKSPVLNEQKCHIASTFLKSAPTQVQMIRLQLTPLFDWTALYFLYVSIYFQFNFFLYMLCLVKIPFFGENCILFLSLSNF